LNDFIGPTAFSRLGESDDTQLYARDRFVNHLDAVALVTVERLIGQLVVAKDPVILNLMAGWNSHIPRSLHASQVVGLGLNPNELERNPSLTRWLIHDLNKDPLLPLPDDHFDAVVNTVSVDYIAAPIKVSREVGRILKQGGLFLVIFSNRMFPQKATQIWRLSSEEERILLAEDFFRYSELFEEPSTFISKGKPRPADDKYAHLRIPRDPVYAV
jgi:SAM-dependent methyltransferase